MVSTSGCYQLYQSNKYARCDKNQPDSKLFNVELRGAKTTERGGNWSIQIIHRLFDLDFLLVKVIIKTITKFSNVITGPIRALIRYCTRRVRALSLRILPNLLGFYLLVCLLACLFACLFVCFFMKTYNVYITDQIGLHSLYSVPFPFIIYYSRIVWMAYCKMMTTLIF